MSVDEERVRAVQADLTRAVRAAADLLAEAPECSVVDPHDGPTQTEVAIVTSALLEAADIEIFELAMWRSWGTPVAGGG